MDYTEEQVRSFRDKVYGIPTTDKNWNACKSFWMSSEEIQWLLKIITTKILLKPTDA